MQPHQQAAEHSWFCGESLSVATQHPVDQLQCCLSLSERTIAVSLFLVEDEPSETGDRISCWSGRVVQHHAGVGRDFALAAALVDATVALINLPAFILDEGRWFALSESVFGTDITHGTKPSDEWFRLHLGFL